MADNVQANSILRGVKLDLFTKPPMFGIPVIGNILNLPSEVAGLVTSQIPSLTPEGSPALEVARTEGVSTMWDQRTDLSDAQKLAIEFGTSQAIPGFAVTGPLKGVSKTLTSPAVGAVKAVEKAAPKTPVIGKMFQPSAKAVVQTAKEDAGSILEYSKRMNANPTGYAQVLSDFNTGKTTAAETAEKLGLGTAQAKTLTNYTSKLTPQELTTVGNSSNVYDAAMRAIEKSTKASVGLTPPVKQSAIAPAANLLKGANQIVRESGMSGGTTWIANFMDMIAKAQMEGIGVPKFTSNLIQFVKTGGKLDDYDNIVGQLPLDGRLGINKSAIVGLDADTKESILDRLGYLNASLIGGGLGAVAGGASTGSPDPLTIAAGAAGGALTVAGFKGNRALMTLGEAVGRETYFVKGFGDFTIKNADDIAKAFTSSLGPQKGQMINEALRLQGYKVAPENLSNIALQLGFSGDDVSRSVQTWRNIHAEGVEAGVSFSNNIAFNYTRDSNLTEALRQYTPYPVWPVHNIPYFAEKTAEYPIIAALAGDYLASTQKRNEEAGSPFRLNMRTPITDVNGGTVYGNPLSPVSITTQLSEPYPAAPGTTPTVFDKASDILGVIGLSPSTPIQWAGQVTGLLDQQRDFSDFFPATRLIRPATEAVLGKPIDPEAGIKAGLEGIRQNAAPEATPKVEYQEYLIRKKLSEIALRETGKAWFQDDNYAKAMIDDTNPLWKQATQEVGTEQANIYVARRLMPAQLAYISNEEEQIRQASKDLGELPQGLTGADYGQIMTDNPWAFGYKDISDSDAVLNLEVKQTLYYRIPAGTGRKVFMKENPDFQAYMTWYGQQKGMGIKPKIDEYVKLLGAE